MHFQIPASINSTDWDYLLNWLTFNDTPELSSDVCNFQSTTSLLDFKALISDANCYRHSSAFTIFLIVANLVIFTFGLVGNSVVVFVVVCKLQLKTVSSIFMLNLAIADLLVILCCIPPTVVANIFTPWVFSELTCKIVAYAQGLSVFCSVYSLVAISFDRCRAIHPIFATRSHISTKLAHWVVLVIWVIGSLVTLPWLLVFKVLNAIPQNVLPDDWTLHPLSALTDLHSLELPFCQEVWPNRTQEAVYFLSVHVGAVYIVPLILISMCNVLIWKSTPGSSQSLPSTQNLVVSGSLGEIQQRRKRRILKMFTALNFAFFLFWLPLYVIMGKMKFFEHHDLMPVLVPLSQLLGSCNSCINPVLYAFLSEKFRKSFLQLFSCLPLCSIFSSNSNSISATVVRQDGEIRTEVVLESKRLIETTAV